MQLLVDRKPILTTDHFCVTSNIALANFVISRTEKRRGYTYIKTNIDHSELQLRSYLNQFSIVIATAGRS